MAELITIGEPLVVLASKDLNAGLIKSENFYKSLGGAELNVLIGAARLGHSTEYISSVGKDPFGDYSIEKIAQYQVGNRYISRDLVHWTGFYLKELVEHGDPQTYYFRKGSAAAHMDKQAVDDIDLSEVKWAYLSGVFPAISLQARETYNYFVEKLTARGIHTAFDPNLRPSLWNSEEKMIQIINELAKAGEIVMPGIEEGRTLTGLYNPGDIADFYLEQSDITQTVIVKLGSAGAYVQSKTGKSYQVKSFMVEKVVDTVGAGDGFASGVLTSLLEGHSMKESVRRGCAIGALSVMTPGDNDGYPNREQLEAFYFGS
jgi:2-dehydro-3-deoxygluconokinase